MLDHNVSCKGRVVLSGFWLKAAGEGATEEEEAPNVKWTRSLLILNATCVQTAPKAQHAHLWFISNALTKTEVNLMNGFGRIKHEGTQCKSTQTFFSLSVTEEELLMFDLQSLATLATARALEMDSQEGCSAGLGRHFPTRRIFNLRRKCSWTPRNEPVRLKIQSLCRISISFMSINEHIT